MKALSVFSSTFIIIVVFSLTTINALANEAIKDMNGNLSLLPLAQIDGSTITPTATILPIDQATIVSTQEITGTATLEPFPTITLIFPELSSSATPTATPTSKEPSKGIPLSMISSNNPPAQEPDLVYAVIIFWLILVLIVVFIARKVYQLWIE